MELALIEGIATSLDGNSILPIDNDLLLFSHRILMCYLEQELFSRAWAGDSIRKTTRFPNRKTGGFVNLGTSGLAATAES